MTQPMTQKEKMFRLAQKACIGLFAVGVIGFVGLKLYPLVHGPEVDLMTLSNGANLKDPMIRVSGKALYTKDLVVNGNQLPLSPDGSFDEKLLLNPGYNLITIAAKDRFGALKHESYAVILTEEEKPQTFTVRTVEPTTY